MGLHIGSSAPDFTAESSEGVIHLYEYLGTSWGILFSHPKDFTPVCTTELGAAAKQGAEFKRRGVKVLALSVDPTESHKRWIADIEETQSCKIDYPIIADHDRKVAALYDMIHPEANDTFTVRSVFFIDPNKKIRAMITYPASTGRSFDEILRVIDSLQLTDGYKVATPVNWKNGEDVIIVPAVSNEDAKKLFPNGWDEKTPYLRIVKQPNK